MLRFATWFLRFSSYILCLDLSSTFYVPSDWSSPAASSRGSFHTFLSNAVSIGLAIALPSFHCFVVRVSVQPVMQNVWENYPQIMQIGTEMSTWRGVSNLQMCCDGLQHIFCNYGTTFGILWSHLKKERLSQNGQGYSIRVLFGARVRHTDRKMLTFVSSGNL